MCLACFISVISLWITASAKTEALRKCVGCHWLQALGCGWGMCA